MLLTPTLTLTLTLIRFSRTGSNVPCLDDFGFPDFVIRVGVCMACLSISFLLAYILRAVYFLLAYIACRLFSCGVSSFSDSSG